ncbi:MAG: alpha/beta fold hydrolase [Christensenellales bacterium]
MSEFLFKGKKVYYELHGEGEPILVLNGIMMSTESWNAFKPSFSKDNLLILVDFFDQGRSDRLISSTNTICRWICSKLCSNT